MSRARQVSQLIGASNTHLVSTPATFSNTVTVAASGITYSDSTVQLTAPAGFGFKNRIINGAMMIDQRNAGGSANTSVLQGTTYTLDRWCYYNDVVSKRSIQQSSDAPAGFSKSILVTVIATDTVGPQQYFRQAIEGYNLQDLNWGTANAQSATLSFWVKSSVTGQHGGTIQSSNSNYSYPFAYTIVSANTWEYKTILITGPTSGTWSTTNGVGASLMFEHGVGYQKNTAGVWTATNATSSTGSVNLCATNGATWYITGVQLEKGSTATAFDYRSYPYEFSLCQRYYYKYDPTVSVYGITAPYNSSNWWIMIQLPVRMRAVPTVSATYTGGSMTPYITADRVHFNAGTQSIYVDTLAVSSEL